ncbi:MAG: hypothetical protein LBH79_03975, partial [Nitrososphaerota archaeon]|nr:hypothetical protein [Nitrososphaerota archaeon]
GCFIYCFTCLVKEHRCVNVFHTFHLFIGLFNLGGLTGPFLNWLLPEGQLTMPISCRLEEYPIP